MRWQLEREEADSHVDGGTMIFSLVWVVASGLWCGTFIAAGCSDGVAFARGYRG